MLSFIGVFALGVTALLAAQRLDIECTQPRKPAKAARLKDAKQPNLNGALAQS